MPWAQEAGCVVIDNSSAYRLDDNVPLVVPEINPEDIFKHQGIIANPNCSTIIALMALHDIDNLYHINRIICTTFQAVSGAGVKGISDLEREIQDIHAAQKLSSIRLHTMSSLKLVVLMKMESPVKNGKCKMKAARFCILLT